VESYMTLAISKKGVALCKYLPSGPYAFNEQLTDRVMMPLL